MYPSHSRSRLVLFRRKSKLGIKNFNNRQNQRRTVVNREQRHKFEFPQNVALEVLVVYKNLLQIFILKKKLTKFQRRTEQHRTIRRRMFIVL